MADEFEIAKNVLDVLSESSALTSSFTAVSSVLHVTPMFASVLPIIGMVFGLIKKLLPDKKHEEILHCFENLSNQIDQVREDIRELEKTIKWENVKLQYGDAVDRITLGMHYSLEIGKAKEKDSKIRYQEKLRELCSNQECTLALRELMDGIIGSGNFRKSILDEFYEKTKGHRPKISSLSNRLLQLVSGGLMVNAAYEVTVRGEKGVIEMMKGYEKRMPEVSAKVRSVLNRCVNNFREHMYSDLKDILNQKGPSNQALADQLCAFMHDKYDWLEHYCVVYDDLRGYKKHCLGGNLIVILHYNGKCGVVFYRTKGQPPMFSHRYDEAYKIVDHEKCRHARKCYDNIAKNLAGRGIPWTSCAIIRRTANVRFAGKFSTRIVQMVGSNAHAILMLE